MIVRSILVLTLGIALSLVLTISASAQDPGKEARIVYIGEKDDPFYQPQPVYTGLSLRDRNRPLEAVEIAVRSARVLSRALGLKFSFDVVLVEPGAKASEEVLRAADAGTIGILVDLPKESLQEVLNSDATAGLLFNIRHMESRWRSTDCALNLLHTIPSHAMLADALAQHLRQKGWDRVLLLRGASPEDIAEAESVRSAIRKFGLHLADDRLFELTNDPRRRDQNNIALLTGDARHDVIWLVDNDGEYGRFVPYDTYSPRPVVGSEGLSPTAWHWTYERHGAPQLNQRFRRKTDRNMTSLDWAGWVAARALIESVSRVGSADPEAVRDYILSDALSLDLYKGVTGSFRGWNGQLRQPLLLATHNAVIGVAPYSAFEHQTDILDTLGIDAGETTCER